MTADSGVSEQGQVPWDIFPALRRERLVAVAKLMWDASVSAAADAKWEAGDNALSIGVTAFLRARHSITRAALKAYAEWLSVADFGMHFVYSIGGIHLRHFKGNDETDAPVHMSVPDPREKLALQYALDLPESRDPDYVPRLVIEKDGACSPSAVFFALVSPSGEQRNRWRVPVEEVATVLPIDAKKEPPVTPPGPQVTDEEAEREKERLAREAKNADKNQKGA